MRIRIATGTVSSPSQRFGGDPVAEMFITPTGLRAFREKGVKHPGLTSEPGIPVWDGNPELFELDPDRLGLDNLSWVPGTTFSATGVLGYEFGGYEIWPTELTGLTVFPALPHAARARRAGEVTVASVNMLRLDDGSPTYGTKRSKLALYIRNVLRSPDIIGVQEVFTLSALEGLAEKIRTDDSRVRYTAYLELGNRGDTPNVGFLVRSGVTVRSEPQQHDKTTMFTNPMNSMGEILFTRPPLQLDAAVQGIEFSVIVVHNRSLLGLDGSQAARVRQKRFEQAQAVALLAESLEDEKLIIVGDFNAFQFTDGYVDVIGQLTGDVTASENLLSGSVLVDPNLIDLIDRVPEAQRYSYSFENNTQLLDHALVNEEMTGSVVDIQYARGNVDARAAYETDPDSPLGASDHDGFVVYLAAPGRPGPGPTVTPVGADLSIDAQSKILSEDLVRFTVEVRNEGPKGVSGVFVRSSFAPEVAAASLSTSGCAEDPDGASDCGLGYLGLGQTARFTIDVAIDAARDRRLTYRAAVSGNGIDPDPEDSSIKISKRLGTPRAPSDLTAAAVGSSSVRLRWRDNSPNETEFAVFFQGPGDSSLRLFRSVPANRTSVVVAELVPNITYNFAVESRNGLLRSGRTPMSTATTWAEANLHIEGEGRIVSEELVRYTVSVRNAGPEDASAVVVTSSLTAAEGSLVTSTSGCREDPSGVPQCSLNNIDVGESESFTIDVAIDAASRNSLTYRGAVRDVADPRPQDDTVEITVPLGRPEAPSQLEATVLSGMEVELRWRDNSDRETGFGILLQGPGDSKLELIRSVPANTTSTVVHELVPNTTYGFAVEARNGLLRSGRTPMSTATTWAEANLHIEGEGRIVSEELVRYTVSVRNAGPEDASAVVVTSSLTAAEGSLVTSTSGCREDPSGVPQCSLNNIDVGESESFTIDVAIDAASRNSLTYRGAVRDVADPRPQDDTVEITVPLGRPEAPSQLEATVLSGMEVELRWRDNSDRETGFGILLQGPGDSKLELIRSVPANTTSTVVHELVPNTTYGFAVEARNGLLRSGRTPMSTATTWAEANLHIEGEGRIVSEELVRYTVSVRNAGPEDASAVVVTSSLTAAEGSLVTSTSGCREDPSGVPQCSLDDIDVGESESFTIDVAIDAASPNSLTYRGAVRDVADPRPQDDTVEITVPLGRSEAPSQLEATVLSGTEVELRWRDNSDRETGFGVLLQGPGDSKLQLIKSVPANTTSTVVHELVPNTTYGFAVEARNGRLRSGRTATSTATTWGEANLHIEGEGRIVSEEIVRYTVSVRNAGPEDASAVVVTSSLTAAEGSLVTSTSGCREDPSGVPQCSLDNIDVGESESFTIDVAIDAASPNSLTYHGAVRDVADPRPQDDTVEITVPLGRSEAPSQLEATVLSGTEVELRWRDNSDRETGFGVFLRGPGDSELRMIGTVPANTTSMVVNELVPSITYSFAVEARNGALRSERRPKTTATTWTADAARCGEDDALCVGAFQVEVEWDDGKGRVGRGFAERLTAVAGDFWFFHPANIELVVKVLDGCAINDHYWIYAAGLTDVGVTMTVRDLRSGVEKSWTNPVGTRFRPITDSSAFATCDSGTSVAGQGRIVLSGAPRGRSEQIVAAGLSAADGVDPADGACTADAATRCLLGSRFEVRADWRAGGTSGVATAVPRTPDTGMFWFFSPDNVELVVKVLDGCRENGYRWVLIGGLTDVGVEVTVTDWESGRARMYRNLEGAPFATMFDLAAFACDAGR